MKRILALLLALTLCLSLCACGGAAAVPTTVPTTEPATEPPTEPVPDIAVHVYAPAEWGSVCVWAWKHGGEDAFEAWPGEPMAYMDSVTLVDGRKTAALKVHEAAVPGWVDGIVISAYNGTVQTVDIPVEPGKDLWIHVVDTDYVVVHYEEVDKEVLKQDQDQPAADYHDATHAVLNRGGYQVTDRKFVAYDEYSDRYVKDYVPEELLAEQPEEICYVIHLENKNKIVGTYFGAGSMISAIQPGIKLSIQELATGKVLAESDVFEGGEPPESIRTGESGRGEEPDYATIEDWVRSAAEGILAKSSGELPLIPLNEDALSEGEKAVMNAAVIAKDRRLSYKALVRYLSEEVSDPCTPEEAKRVADTCGVDWKENALLQAKNMISRYPFGYDELIDRMITYNGFTKEEAVYAVENCGADWGAQGVQIAKKLMERQPTALEGYYSRALLVKCLIDEEGLSEDQAAYAADNCGADWKNQAKLEAQRAMGDPNEIGYSESGLMERLTSGVDDYGRGFTKEEAEYAMTFVKADWGNEAAKRAKFYLEYVASDYTKQEMIETLMDLDGFSEADATYGAEMNGLK